MSLALLVLWLHILSGTLAIAAGATAMVARKGSRVHRRSGMVFVVTMLVMSAIGFLVSTMKPISINIVAGALTFYLVATAALTVRKTVPQARVWIVAFMIVAMATAVAAALFGMQALRAESGKLEGLPAAVYFAFAGVASVSALLDARMLHAGRIEGIRRLARHLWRMCVAMLIATASLFLGQAKIFPEAMREMSLLAVPVVLVLLYLLYWWVRILRLRERAVVGPWAR